MVEKMCTFYGEEIGSVAGVKYLDFPTVDKLAAPSVLDDLKKAAFGYRAKFIQNAASRIIEFGGTEWIRRLQTMPYEDVKSELMKLPGIGAKVYPEYFLNEESITFFVTPTRAEL